LNFARTNFHAPLFMIRGQDTSVGPAKRNAELRYPLMTVSPVESRCSVDLIARMTIVLAKPTEKQVRKEVRAMRKAAVKVAATRESARAFLRKHGFITKANRLTKRYR
jgi:hypothetical protein